MKKYIIYALLALPLIIVSCSKDDNDTPEPVNEEEVITTMTVTLTPKEGFEAETVTLQTKDLDGDGPNAPVISVSDFIYRTQLTNRCPFLNLALGHCLIKRSWFSAV